MTQDSTVRRVLIADDDLVVRNALRTALEGAGMRVVAEAADGKEAVKFFEEQKPDVVCLDVEMPEMKGLDVLAKIRRTSPSAVVLLISAFATGQNVRAAMQLRADGMIAKPFTREKVTGEIQRAFAKKSLKK